MLKKINSVLQYVGDYSLDSNKPDDNYDSNNSDSNHNHNHNIENNDKFGVLNKSVKNNKSIQNNDDYDSDSDDRIINKIKSNTTKKSLTISI